MGGYVWAGVADLVRRLVLVSAAVFASNHPLLQMGVLGVVVLSTVLFSVEHKPYFVEIYNTLNTRLNAVLLTILSLGGASYASRADPSPSPTLTVLTIAAVAVMVLISVVGVGPGCAAGRGSQIRSRSVRAQAA